jgi:hypothetical protein
MEMAMTRSTKTTYTRYVVLPDGKTFDVLDDCRIVDVPDDVDDVEGYIQGKATPRFEDNYTPTLWHNEEDDR